MSQIQAQHSVTGFDECKVNGEVCAGAGVRLNAGVVSAEELLRAFDGDILNDINTFTTAVVAFSGKTFGVFVGQNGSHRSHHCLGNNILRRNQLDVAFLTSVLSFDRVADFWVVLCDEFHNLVYHSKKPP